ncbi:MAG: flagellar basal body L-ring protein FlgH [Phycisphaerales bacterium]
MKAILPAILIAAVAMPAFAQSASPSDSTPVERDPAANLYGVSLFVVRPPEPRAFKIHDIITIIVNESSTQTSEQTLETTKETEGSATLGATLSIEELLNLRLENSSISDLELLRYAAEREFEGEGEYERTDRITDRLSATVIDVKPNGVLVLEARRFTASDEETKTVVLSGNCRSEDVTEQNTIQSNQLADLRLEVKHEGEVRDAATKGPLTRFVEWILPF